MSGFSEMNNLSADAGRARVRTRARGLSFEILEIPMLRPISEGVDR